MIRSDLVAAIDGLRVALRSGAVLPLADRLMDALAFVDDDRTEADALHLIRDQAAPWAALALLEGPALSESPPDRPCPWAVAS